MTAIARIYTPEGFVVAADGRKLNNQTGESSDDVQKIFELSHVSGRMCFSVAGVGEFLGKSTRMVSDVISASARFIAEVPVRNSDDYAELLRKQICLELQDWKLSWLASGTVTETYINIDGYILGLPMRRAITLNYKSERSQMASFEAESLDPGVPYGNGSSIVRDILFGSFPDSRLASYRQICQSKPVSLSQAIRVCEATIRAHHDEEALAIDRKNCEGVGGRIHIATVTPAEGFSWVILPAT